MLSVYLVRHAIAAERGEAFPDDTVRPLTRKGRARMRLAVAGLRTLKPGIEVILTSPLVRAAQTAAILAAGLPGGVPVCPSPALAPGRGPLDVAQALGALKKVSAVALVGHEPDLGALGAWLIGARAPLVFRKGGIARIDIESLEPLASLGSTKSAAPEATLVWLATPAMLRALSGDAD